MSSILSELVLEKIILPIARIYFHQISIRFGKLALWKFLFWRKFNLITKTKFNSIVKVRTNETIQCYIYYFGVWEPNLTVFMESRFREDNRRTFIDIGANVGYFTLLGSKYLDSGTVVSTEAHPSIYEKLRENLKLNKVSNSRAVNIAVTDRDTTLPIYIGGDMNEGATTTLEGIFDSKPIYIRGLPLSEILLSSEVSSTRLVKIDVEGAELSVIKGMVPLLKEMPNDVEIVVEITPQSYSVEELELLFSIFDDAGFFPYSLKNDYNPLYYLFSQETEKPVRMKSIPESQVDVVFSRIDTKFLL